MPATGDGGGGAAPAQQAAQQAAALRSAEAALRELQVALKRSEKGVDLMFVKNLLVRCLKDGDVDNTLPAIAQALEMSPDEVAQIREGQKGVMGEVGRVLRLW
jgi:hypothetical protein